MQANDFYRKYMPYAKMVQKATGIPAELEAAFWSWETDFAKNQTYKVNNMSGITKGSDGKDFVDGAYAGYNSLDRYVADRIRMLNKPDTAKFKFGYAAILATARNGGSYEEITRAHNASKWSEADYNVATIVSRAKAAKLVAGGGEGYSDPKAGPAICPTCHLPVPRH